MIILILSLTLWFQCLRESEYSSTLSTKQSLTKFSLSYGCPIDGLTIQQKERAIHVYETWRLPTKQAIENKRIGHGNRQQANNQVQPLPNQHQQENIQPQPNRHQSNAQREDCLRQAKDKFDYSVELALEKKFNELQANYNQKVWEANRYLNDGQYFGWARQEINNAVGTFNRQWDEYRDGRAPLWVWYRQMYAGEQSLC